MRNGAKVVEKETGSVRARQKDVWVQKCRQLQGSNLCGQSPPDFKSGSLDHSDKLTTPETSFLA